MLSIKLTAVSCCKNLQHLSLFFFFLSNKQAKHQYLHPLSDKRDYVHICHASREKIQDSLKKVHRVSCMNAKQEFETFSADINIGFPPKPLTYSQAATDFLSSNYHFHSTPRLIFPHNRGCFYFLSSDSIQSVNGSQVNRFI